MKTPKNYALMEAKSGSYAVPKNIYGLLNSLQLSTNLDTQNRISKLIKARHDENPILKLVGNKWKRADLSRL